LKHKYKYNYQIFIKGEVWNFWHALFFIGLSYGHHKWIIEYYNLEITTTTLLHSEADEKIKGTL